ncbi:MAG TPA: isochorismatase family cysteine hydrolase [Stenomitos sp.]
MPESSTHPDLSAQILVPSRPHSFPLVLSQTALLIIDMQYDFCHPDGYSGSVLQADLSAAIAIVPRIQAVLDWARSFGLMVVYTRESHRLDLSDLSDSKRDRYINAGYPVGSLGKMGRFLVQGEPGTNILEDLQPLATELVLDKPAQSAFVATDLEAQLRSHNITHLIFTGVTTECCVLGSYRHASDLGFYGLLLEDCCAAFSAQEHQAALDVLTAEGGAIGWVSKSEELLAIAAPPHPNLF